MSKPLLVIGNKNYSSWSLRPWLLMRGLDIDFDEKLIPLFDENWDDAIAKISPTKKVPYLIDGDIEVWETLAIIEYMADIHPEKNVWPKDLAARTRARAISSEMHAGFGALRTHMPMNIRKSFPGRGMEDGVAADIARVTQIWRECREQFGDDGDFLFGNFCAADAMYAPVVSRLTTFDVPVDDVSRAYMNAVQTLPAMQAWTQAALAETWIVMEDEID